eukprot:GFUD01023341.1.p1 GENE.GFUD01023341.1~~GFUD01023341.1.p1  ORF type:complete len:120 (-),score=10.74 GFUD01023341.1:417-776(-)
MLGIDQSSSSLALARFPNQDHATVLHNIVSKKSTPVVCLILRRHHFAVVCYYDYDATSKYRSHLLKYYGLLTALCSCPSSASPPGTPPTPRGNYCPLNKDGKHNTGASLTVIKRKKNAT